MNASGVQRKSLSSSKCLVTLHHPGDELICLTAATNRASARSCPAASHHKIHRAVALCTDAEVALDESSLRSSHWGEYPLQLLVEQGDMKTQQAKHLRYCPHMPLHNFLLQPPRQDKCKYPGRLGSSGRCSTNSHICGLASVSFLRRRQRVIPVLPCVRGLEQSWSCRAPCWLGDPAAEGNHDRLTKFIAMVAWGPKCLSGSPRWGGASNATLKGLMRCSARRSNRSYAREIFLAKAAHNFVALMQYIWQHDPASQL